jgi:hypothetical protein
MRSTRQTVCESNKHGITTTGRTAVTVVNLQRSILVSLIELRPYDATVLRRFDADADLPTSDPKDPNPDVSIDVQLLARLP